MRVLVCGDRNWANKESVFYELVNLLSYELQGDEFVVITGACRGADWFAREWCELHQRTRLMEFPADWQKHGKAAGPIRNQQMLDEGVPDLVLAFHADITNSKGTLDMIHRANKARVPVHLIPS